MCPYSQFSNDLFTLNEIKSIPTTFIQARTGLNYLICPKKSRAEPLVEEDIDGACLQGGLRGGWNTEKDLMVPPDGVPSLKST